MYGGEFLKPKSVYVIKTGDFLVCYIFKGSLEPVGVYVHLRAFSEHSQLCFHVVYPFDCFVISVPIFCSQIFLPL